MRVKNIESKLRSDTGMASIRVIGHYSDFSLIPKSLNPAFLRSKPVNQVCQKATPESTTEQAVQACRDTKLHESLSYPYRVQPGELLEWVED